MARQPEPLTGGDRYGAIIPLDWLDGEAIGSVVWDSPGLDRSLELIEDNVISAFFELSAGESYGKKMVTMEVTTDTTARSKCFYMSIEAAECQG